MKIQQMSFEKKLIINPIFNIVQQKLNKSVNESFCYRESEHLSHWDKSKLPLLLISGFRHGTTVSDRMLDISVWV